MTRGFSRIVVGIAIGGAALAPVALGEPKYPVPPPKPPHHGHKHHVTNPSKNRGPDGEFTNEAASEIANKTGDQLANAGSITLRNLPYPSGPAVDKASAARARKTTILCSLRAVDADTDGDTDVVGSESVILGEGITTATGGRAKPLKLSLFNLGRDYLHQWSSISPNLGLVCYAINDGNVQGAVSIFRLA